MSLWISTLVGIKVQSVHTDRLVFFDGGKSPPSILFIFTFCPLVFSIRLFHPLHIRPMASMSFNSTTSAEQIDDAPSLDALPYVDVVHEEYEQYALALIEEEMKQIDPQSSSAAKLASNEPVNFRSSAIMETAYQKHMNSGQNGDEDIPFVSNYMDCFTSPPNETEKDVSVWQEAVNKARIAYETERLRALTLQVEKEESTENYKDYLEMQTAMQSILQQQVLEPAKQNVERLNYERQQHQQEHVQPQLERLSAQYQELLSKHHQLSNAIRNESATAS